MGRPQRLVFGEDAELYDRARPSYPTDLIDTVMALVPTPAATPARILDIGCGTGRAAVALAERGTAGIGVEADPAMAALASRNLAAYPDWTVVVSDFETWAPAGAAFDLVTCAQAWHWLDPEVRMPKAHALLRDGGWLALWWNRPADDDSPLRRDIDATYAELHRACRRWEWRSTDARTWPPHTPTLVLARPWNASTGGRTVTRSQSGPPSSVPTPTTGSWTRPTSNASWSGSPR